MFDTYWFWSVNPAKQTKKQTSRGLIRLKKNSGKNPGENPGKNPGKSWPNLHCKKVMRSVPYCICSLCMSPFQIEVSPGFLSNLIRPLDCKGTKQEMTPTECNRSICKVGDHPRSVTFRRSTDPKYSRWVPALHFAKWPAAVLGSGVDVTRWDSGLQTHSLLDFSKLEIPKVDCVSITSYRVSHG